MRKLFLEWTALNAIYPLLEPPVFQGDKWMIGGALPIIDKTGTVWGQFNVRIDIYSNYPSSLPEVTETGGKITRTADWHINNDATCCVGTAAEQFRKLHGRMTLLNWVNDFAVPFFANYIYKKDKGKYFNGEWSHGIRGIYEDYAQLYGIADLPELLQRLRYCSDRETLANNAACFCNSGKKYKRCYLLHPSQHRFYIPKMIIWNDVARLQRSIRSTR